MENLQIASLNVRGLQNKNKRNRIFQYFQSKKYDILSRETYSTVQDENEWKKEWEGPTLISFLPPAGAAGSGPTNTESTGTLARTVLYAQPLVQ